MKYRWMIGVCLLVGCGQQSSATYAITSATADQLFANATHIESEQSNDFIAVTCTFSEGFFCYYLPNPKAAVFLETFDPQIQTAEHLLDDSVSKPLLDELDPKRVERAKNNTVLLKCQRSDDETQCTINGGTQAETLEIR